MPEGTEQTLKTNKYGELSNTLNMTELNAEYLNISSKKSFHLEHTMLTA